MILTYINSHFWTYYLIFCSFLALVLIVERLLFFVTLRRLHQSSCAHIQRSFKEKRFPDECPEIRSSALKEALSLILSHKEQSNQVRLELMNYWLDTHKKEVLQRLGWLSIIAFAALLGGIMAFFTGCFQSIDILTSFNPHEFIPTLKQHLLFMLYGMAIAFPIFILLKIFRLWGKYYLTSVQKSLKIIILSMEASECPYGAKVDDH